MPPEKSENNVYTSKNIQSITPREHIRRRPGMYIGGTDSRALHHLIWEVVDNALDEAMVGGCNEISITLHENNRVTISDNGSGIPVEADSRGRTLLEIFLTQVGCGWHNLKEYSVSGGLHGVGISAVNALAANLTAEVKRNGYLWRQSYTEGIPTTEVEKVRPLDKNELTGTSISFTPDFTIMDAENSFDYERIVARCRELAYLLPNIIFRVTDEREEGKHSVLHSEQGLSDWVAELSADSETLHPILSTDYEKTFTDKEDNDYVLKVSLAFQFSRDSDTEIKSFVNMVETLDGGAHVGGLQTALMHAVYGEDTSYFEPKLRGLVAVVSIFHIDPQYESCSTVRLLNPDAVELVASAIKELLAAHPDVVESLRKHFISEA